MSLRLSNQSDLAPYNGIQSIQRRDLSICPTQVWWATAGPGNGRTSFHEIRWKRFSRPSYRCRGKADSNCPLENQAVVDLLSPDIIATLRGVRLSLDISFDRRLSATPASVQAFSPTHGPMAHGARGSLTVGHHQPHSYTPSAAACRSSGLTDLKSVGPL